MGRCHIRNIMVHMKGPEEITSKRNKWLEIIKPWFKINNIKAKKQTKIIRETKYWICVKIIDIETPLHIHTYISRQSRSESTELGMKSDITTDPEEIQRILRTHLQVLHSTKLEKLKEICNFLNIYDIPKLNQEQISNLKTYNP